MNRRHCGWFAVLALLVASAPAAFAAGDSDAREISAYRLTQSAVAKADAVTQAIARNLGADARAAQRRKLEAEADALEQKSDPTEAEIRRMEQIQEELDRDPAGLDLGEGKSLSEMEAILNRTPAAAGALRANGMSAREYLRFSMCLMQTSLAVAMKREGYVKTLPPEVAPENAQFVQQNWAQLDAMGKRWKALSGD